MCPPPGPVLKNKKCFYREAQFESTFQITIIFFGLIWTPVDDLRVNDKWWQTLVAFISLSSSLFTICKASTESLLTFGQENKLADVSLFQQLKMIAKFSPVFALTTFFRAGCLCSTTMAAGVGSYGYGVNSGFYAAAFSVPLVLTVPLVVLMLFKWFLPEVTLGNLMQGVLGEALTITLFGKAGREGSRRIQLAMAVFHLVLHTVTTIIVLATMPSHRASAFFNGFAITSLSCGWIAFGLFLLQIFNMDQDINVTSMLKNLVCTKK